MPIDYGEYPENWPEISLRIRFIRARNRCEECGAENYKPHPDTGSKVVLTVAHLSENKMDVRDENLKALCQRCHLHLDLPKHIYNRKYGRDTRKLNYNLFQEGAKDADIEGQKAQAGRNRG